MKIARTKRVLKIHKRMWGGCVMIVCFFSITPSVSCLALNLIAIIIESSNLNLFDFFLDGNVTDQDNFV